MTVKKPKALDLFCCAGGASMGLHQAGFDVTGVDNRPQPHYPFRFFQADALSFPIDEFDFIWASPPCQAFTPLRHLQAGKVYPNLIPETRSRLVSSGVLYSIENVEAAPLGDGDFLTMLCGTMFGLGLPQAELRRHRLFETNFSIPLRPECHHNQPTISVYGDKPRDCRRGVITVVGHTPVSPRRRAITVAGHSSPCFFDARKRAISVTGSTAQTNLIHNRERRTFSVVEAREAMGIAWMTMKELSQAIPPAYSEFIGRHAISYLERPSSLNRAVGSGTAVAGDGPADCP